MIQNSFVRARIVKSRTCVCQMEKRGHVCQMEKRGHGYGKRISEDFDLPIFKTLYLALQEPGVTDIKYFLVYIYGIGDQVVLNNITETKSFIRRQKRYWDFL